MSRNLTHEPLGPNNWDPTDPPRSLAALYEHAKGQAERSIKWYHDHLGAKRVASKLIRGSAIALAGLGGLAPLFGQAGVETLAAVDISKLGYILLGTAAVLVGLDRFFGFSTGYVRYVTTALALQNALTKFQIDWTELAAQHGGLKEPVAPFLSRVRSFLESVQGLVETETHSWASEFQSNLTELERQVKTEQEAVVSGALEVEVTNAAEADGPVLLFVDGALRGRLNGSLRAQISPVFPGQHEVGARTTIKGKPTEATATVVVEKGRTSEITLSVV